MKHIRHLLIAIIMICAAPVAMEAAVSIEIIEQEQMPVITVQNDSQLRIQNGNGLTVYIYNVAGMCVQTFKVDGLDRHYDLNLSKGCYIVKVGKTVRKISLK